MKFNFKVLLLLVALLQVALMQPNDNDADDHGGPSDGDFDDLNRDNGKQCKITTTPGGMVTLSKSHPTLERDNAGLTDLKFSGSCNCKLVLWDKKNLLGAIFTYPFSRSMNHDIKPSKIWPHHKVLSYTIVCNF